MRRENKSQKHQNLIPCYPSSNLLSAAKKCFSAPSKFIYHSALVTSTCATTLMGATIIAHLDYGRMTPCSQHPLPHFSQLLSSNHTGVCDIPMTHQVCSCLDACLFCLLFLLIFNQISVSPKNIFGHYPKLKAPFYFISPFELVLFWRQQIMLRD